MSKTRSDAHSRQINSARSNCIGCSTGWAFHAADFAASVMALPALCSQTAQPWLSYSGNCGAATQELPWGSMGTSAEISTATPYRIARLGS